MVKYSRVHGSSHQCLLAGLAVLQSALVFKGHPQGSHDTRGPPYTQPCSGAKALRPWSLTYSASHIHSLTWRSGGLERREFGLVQAFGMLAFEMVDFKVCQRK